MPVQRVGHPVDRGTGDHLERAGEGETADLLEDLRQVGCENTEEVGRNLEWKENDHRQDVEEVVNRRSRERPFELLSKGDVAEADQGVGDRGADIGPHHDRDGGVDGHAAAAHHGHH